MTSDADAGMARSSGSPELISVNLPKRRWKRFRSTAIVLATQVAILAAFLIVHLIPDYRATPFIYQGF